MKIKQSNHCRRVAHVRRYGANCARTSSWRLKTHHSVRHRQISRRWFLPPMCVNIHHMRHYMWFRLYNNSWKPTHKAPILLPPSVCNIWLVESKVILYMVRCGGLRVKGVYTWKRCGRREASYNDILLIHTAHSWGWIIKRGDCNRRVYRACLTRILFDLAMSQAHGFCIEKHQCIFFIYFYEMCRYKVYIYRRW